MPIRDVIMMGPLDKYQHYDRFPWKFLIHIILIVATTLQVYFMVLSQGNHFRSHAIVFYQMLYDDDNDYQQFSYPRTKHFFNLPDLVKFIQDSVKKYYDLQNGDMLDAYVQKSKEDSTCYFKGKSNEKSSICPIQMDVSYVKKNIDPSYQLEYFLTPNNMELFDDKYVDDGQLKAFIQTISSFTLHYEIKTDYSRYQDFQISCFNWQIQQTFSFEDRNIISLTLGMDTKACDHFSEIANKPFIGLNTAVVFILALISIILQIKYYLKIGNVYNKIRSQYKTQNDLFVSEVDNFKENERYKKQLSYIYTNTEVDEDDISMGQFDQMTQKNFRNVKWENLRFSEKAKIFNYWSIVIVIGNFFQIFGSVMFLGRDIIPLMTQNLFVGLGNFLCWVSITKYVEHAPAYSFFSRTISYSGPDICRNLINVIPLFIGFAMLGMSLFWEGYRFRNPSIAFFSLYCIMMGDEISNTFNEVMQINTIVGGIFVFLFVFMSMQVMMNIFLIIIGDSYSVIKDKHKYDWLEEENLIKEGEEGGEEEEVLSSDEDFQNKKDKTPTIEKRQLSFLTLKHIVKEDLDKWKKKTSLKQNQPQNTTQSEILQFTQTEDVAFNINTKGTRKNIVSEEFDLQISDDKDYQDKIDDFFNTNRANQQTDTNQIQEGSMASMAMKIEKEFSPSFYEKLNPQLKETLGKIRKLKQNMGQTGDKCRQAIRKDLKKFTDKIRKSANTGELDIEVASKSIKDTKIQVLKEIIELKEQIQASRVKLEKEESISDEQSDDEKEVKDKQE
ncbi:UNKNOWN [Stylonychia lemnae]|uniref:Polycystin cation channel PKD1/PKD2 domain-containing protein n=1 Tax=Stylonychia lemnae TaxID=5949 RepID=A0A078ACK0_STYLE|nr:UNKNOWN [Stylonychia lemnae]|eukprot:CDW79317.1 UNKNOWN [Stylonychia lemnae]